MGEAKRRKEKDPYYGVIPKAGRGIVISNPVEFKEDGSMFMKSSEPDSVELRRAALFWDRIEWPKSRFIHFDSSHPDVCFLIGQGLLTRPETKKNSGDLSDLAQSLVDVYLDNEKAEPGLWTMSEGPDSLIVNRPEYSSTAGMFLELNRAIPLPDKEAPLEDLLKFKERRIEELHELNLAIDQLLTRVMSAENTESELKVVIEEIDKRCANIIRVGRESGITFRVSDLKVDYKGSLDAKKIMKDAVVGYFAGAAFGLGAVGALLNSAASLKIDFSGGLQVGYQGKGDLKSSPYRFVSHLHNDAI